MQNKIRGWFNKINVAGPGLLFQTTPFVSLSKVEQGSGKLSGLFSGTDLATFTGDLFTFAISLGAIIAVVRLMWAGYLYMGGDIIGNKSRAKTVFQEVIIGLLLLLSIYLILQKINPQLLNIQVLTSITGAQSTGQQAPAGTQAQGTQTCGGACSYCDQGTGVCLAPN